MGQISAEIPRTPGSTLSGNQHSGGVGTFAIQLAKHLGATVATTTSAQNIELVKSLGADVVIDYKLRDFEDVVTDYDLVVHSQDSKALEKSLRVLKPGGRLISLSGPPDYAFAKALGLNWFVKLLFALLSRRAFKKAEKLGVRYSFMFMRADGRQLREISLLIESGVIRPVVEKVFPFAKAGDALAYVDAGRAKGKAVVVMQ
jgi:NADPH:quinone reductase-like Zn-dependent oxidoreductase